MNSSARMLMDADINLPTYLKRLNGLTRLDGNYFNVIQAKRL